MKRALPALSLLALFVLSMAGCSLLRMSPDVDFEASATEGRAPLAVRFSPQTDGTPVSYAWSFGDGHTSDEPNPVHVFTARGTYSVMLTVGFAECEPVTLIKKRLIAVDTPLRKASEVYLYWISEYARRVRRGSLDGHMTEDLVAEWQTPNGLDVGGGRIYWVTTTLTGGQLASANVDGSDPQTLVREDNRLGDVAVDAKHGKVYWTSLPESPRSAFEPNKTWDGGLRCANLDGSDVETLIEYPSGSEAYADRIVVEPETELLVWSEVGDGFEGRIRRALLSPFRPFALDFVTGTGRPRGMALDTVAGVGANNLYYTTSDELRRVGLYWYGSEATILSGLNGPAGVAVDPIGYYVYIGTPDGILRAVTDGTGLEMLFPNEREVGSIVLPR
jgi:PKD repeat protein